MTEQLEKIEASIARKEALINRLLASIDSRLGRLNLLLPELEQLQQRRDELLAEQPKGAA